MEVKELGHLVLYVRDLNKSVHFYRDVLGWRPIFGGGDDPMPFPAAALPPPPPPHAARTIAPAATKAPMRTGVNR